MSRNTASFSNNLWETHDYHTPGTPTIFRLGTTEGAGNVHEVEYSFSATQHNGNVQQQVIRHSGLSWAQNYTYDSMNRLATAVETGGFDRTYRYDRWGNRWVNPSTGLTNQDPLEPASDIFDDNTNRIAGTGNYDAAGNLTAYAPYTLAYDGENRMVSMTSGANGNMTLSYDGEGRRLKKVWAGAQPATVVYVYDAFGQVAAEYQSGGTTVPGTQYLTQDWLGSTRVVTKEDGTVAARNDFLPFGRPLYAGENGRTEAMKYGVAPVGTAGRPWVRQLFTGHERDVEVDSGLDFFEARYMASAQGRFTSPDPTLLSVNAYNPQSWNRYTYVLNNPLKYIDPFGLWEVDAVEEKDKKGKTIVRVYARRTEENDDGASLAKQLGLTGKDADKFAAKIDGDNVLLSGLGGDVGGVFKQVEAGLTDQVRFNADPKNAAKVARGEGPSHSDCSRTACQIGLGINMMQVGTNVLDPMLGQMARSVSPDQARIGDIIRYAKSDNVATHFANFIFRNVDGTPVAFSKSGEVGPYHITSPAALQVPNYGTIRGIGGADSGYYRRR